MDETSGQNFQRIPPERMFRADNHSKMRKLTALGCGRWLGRGEWEKIAIVA